MSLYETTFNFGFQAKLLLTHAYESDRLMSWLSDYR